MTTSQVICFMRSAQTLSFTKAARDLFISQPAVSKQVAHLETELGFPLFDRTQNGLRLTDGGRLALTYFEDSQRNYEAMRNEAKHINEARGHTIRIGCLEGWDLDYFFPDIEDYFKLHYPNMTFRLTGYSFWNIIEALRSSEVDLILSLYTNLLDHPDIPNRKLTTTSGILVYSFRHRLAGRKDPTLADFRDDTFLTIAEPAGDRNTSRHVRETCMKAGFTPAIINMPSLATAYMKIQSGEGVLLVDKWIMASTSPQFMTIPVDVTFDIGLGWLEDETDKTKNLVVNELLFLFKQLGKRV